MATLQFKPPYLWSAGILWPLACTAVVIARFTTRKAQGLRYGWDDWLTLPALALICTLGALMIVGVAEKAMGHPTPQTGSTFTSTSRAQTITRKIFWVYLVLQTPAIAFVKLSCVAFYRRVFHTGTSNITDILLLAFALSVVCWGIAFTVALLFACGSLAHLSDLWTSLQNQERCTLNQPMLLKGVAYSDVIMDVLLLAFPMPYIWQLRMKLRQKLGVVVIFLFGILSTAASTMRLVILVQTLNIEFLSKTDADFLSTDTAYFMLLEAGFAMIAICLPSLASAMHLEAVRTFFANISGTFSISTRSIQSVTALQPNDKDHSPKAVQRSSESSA